MTISKSLRGLARRVFLKGEKMDQKIVDISLLLLYLTGWEEESKKHPGKKYYKAWKNHPFEILDELQDQKMIRTFFNLKSVLITEEGKLKAERLKQKYL